MALYNWIKRHAAMTIAFVVWTLALVTWATVQVFGDSPPDIPAGTAAAYGALLALPPAAIALWKWRRDRND